MSEAKTAYEQSILAAKALMMSARAGREEMERAETEEKAAKRAFRTAYEFWEEMQPPVMSADYFTLAVSKCQERYRAEEGNRLAQILLKAVFDWLEWKAMDQKEVKTE